MSASKKILVIGNANDKFIVRYIHKIVKMQCEVVLVNSTTEEMEEKADYYQYYNENGVTVITVNDENIYSKSLKCMTILESYGVFEICHIMFVSEFACILALLLAESQIQFLVANFFGTDFYAPTSDMWKAQKMLLDNTDCIIVPIDKMKDEIIKKYPEYKGMVHTVYFESSVFWFLKNNEGSLDEFLPSEKINKNKILIAAGYKGGEYQQHEFIINALQMCSREFKEKIQVVFMKTYGSETEDYHNKIQGILKNVDFEYIVIDTFLSDEQMAALRKRIDIFINAIRTDAFNAALQESMWCQSIIMCGSWLNYPNLQTDDAFIIPFDKERDLSKKLMDIFADFETYKENALQNKNVIMRFENARENVENWEEFYPEQNNVKPKKVYRTEIILYVVNRIVVQMERVRNYNAIFEKWFQNIMDGVFPFRCYLKKHNIQNLVIYGAGTLGLLLYKEISEERINIWFCDKNVNRINALDIDVLKAQDLGDVECELVIVTPIHFFPQIKNDIKPYIQEEKIISMEDIL